MQKGMAFTMYNYFGRALRRMAGFLGMWISQPWIEWVFGDCIDGLISLAGRAGGNSRHKAEALRQLVPAYSHFDCFRSFSRRRQNDARFFHPKKLPARRKIIEPAEINILQSLLYNTSGQDQWLTTSLPLLLLPFESNRRRYIPLGRSAVLICCKPVSKLRVEIRSPRVL